MAQAPHRAASQTHPCPRGMEGRWHGDTWHWQGDLGTRWLPLGHEVGTPSPRQGAQPALALTVLSKSPEFTEFCLSSGQPFRAPRWHPQILSLGVPPQGMEFPVAWETRGDPGRH